MTEKTATPLLRVENLRVCFGRGSQALAAVKKASLYVRRGRISALVGESGSGKTATALSVVGLLDYPGRVVGGDIYLQGKNLAVLSGPERRALLGKEIGMVFQDPFDSLNPRMTIGRLMLEALYPGRHRYSRKDRERAAAALAQMRLSEAAKLMEQYPYQLSGGMCQRVMIAIAMALKPPLLIADEPTTALDLTIQAEILNELLILKETEQTGILFITHDLRVVAEIADDVFVMKDGEVVEACGVMDLFDHPQHPYTKTLLGAML
jgi:ABC-type dipeptide/oligopeptide/nickel transport system ATPase component